MLTALSNKTAAELENAGRNSKVIMAGVWPSGRILEFLGRQDENWSHNIKETGVERKHD